jgi:hypothetical protein
VANPDRLGDPVAISAVVGSTNIPALPNPGMPPTHPGPVAVLGWVDTGNHPQLSIGVRGVNAGGTGVRGESENGTGVHGSSTGGLAGKFDGSVEITGELRVAGAILVGGVPLTVPDSVFEPDYPLPPLDEVRAYLAEKKHLPNVPSAKTIQQEGLNMREF